MFGRQFKNCYASISKHSVKSITVAAIPAFASILLVYYSESAESAEVYWECTQEAPLEVGDTTGHKHSLGYGTFNKGRNIGTLIVNCVDDTATEAVYMNFDGADTTVSGGGGTYPNSQNSNLDEG